MTQEPRIAVVGGGASGVESGWDADDPERFINRELSWLAFNTRVLEEAENKNYPILERLRFLSISANNLDEFYMVRVSGLQEQQRAGVVTKSQDGLTPAEQLERISNTAGELMQQQQECWAALRKELRKHGIHVLNGDDLTEDDRNWLRGDFMERVFPILTPLAIELGVRGANARRHPLCFIPLHKGADGFLSDADFKKFY